MHDTDRILAELSTLDGTAHEAGFEPETGGEEFEQFEESGELGELGEFEDLESFEEMEFEPEAGVADEAFGEAEAANAAAYEFEGDQELEGDPEFEGDYEFEAEPEFEGAPSLGTGAAAGVGGLSEIDEMELAAELLEVQGEDELEYFLGALLGKVAKGIGAALDSTAGRQLTGLLKNVAKKALPIAGTALGTAIGGPAGAAIASDLTSRAGQLFGLELEGLTREDREFEAARSFVRFAADAAQEAEASLPARDADAAMRAAFAAAARRHAPGLLATGAYGPGTVIRRRRRRGMTGRWVRVAPNQILLYGL